MGIAINSTFPSRPVCPGGIAGATCNVLADRDLWVEETPRGSA